MDLDRPGFHEIMEICALFDHGKSCHAEGIKIIRYSSIIVDVSIINHY